LTRNITLFLAISLAAALPYFPNPRLNVCLLRAEILEQSSRPAAGNGDKPGNAFDEDFKVVL
jgi:hypothetical protein